MSPPEANDERRIAIVGAGISGLLACKHAIEKGFKPVVFEARNNVGGVWSNTIHSTKLQSPKDYFQFSDFPWPESVSETFPDHNQVLDYITSYARRFDLFRHINFNSKVVGINYVSSEDTSCWSMWGGSGEPFSARGKWDVVVQDALRAVEGAKVYQVEFVILCIGKFSDLPNVPQFPKSKGANVFNGEVIHSMDYAAMDKVEAEKFIENKRVTVVGFRKSALDIAAQIARTNGAKNPCTLLFRRVHWTASENLVRFTFRNMNRFSELMIHRPHQTLILWFLALVLSPLRWMFSKLAEWYLKWMYPLKEYDMVPDHSLLGQIRSCMLMVLPQDFYQRVKEGSLVLKKSSELGFYEDGLVLAMKCITASSAPFYRECIHPRIPQLAILGHSESAATLFTFELRSKWLAHFLAGGFRLPTVRGMEEDVERWEKNGRRYSLEDYKRACVGVQLQIHCNDQLCKDMGCNPRRKKWFFPELFSPYHPADYADL
ncbi:UNVERIFIED_CONTAM: putative flavin-containing monooxygenase 1 [Sesamum latifolium]|uniref:Flavin-containing monooxygenase n=1 Tax=Sesamum latifolium TaxID=2727402 RepID=A0AAW2WFF7_9LAMI